MREIDRIIAELRRGYDGDAWHGPSISAALAGVSATHAAARPVPEAHTIWEIVLHMTSWTREVTRRVITGIAHYPVDGDWPAPPSDVTETVWTATRSALGAAQEELAHAVASLPDARLDAVLGEARDSEAGTGVSYYVMLHGLVQHDAYHAGQLSLLRRALRE